MSIATRKELTRQPRRRFTADEVSAMVEAGILGDDENVELIEGELLEMSPSSAHHIKVVALLSRLLITQTDRWVLIQSPVQLDRESEPEPDVTILREGVALDNDIKPQGSDVSLIIEVMKSSGRRDRLAKLPLYARFGVPEVWLCDLDNKLVEVHRQPAGDRYQASTSHSDPEAELSPTELPTLKLKVMALLGDASVLK